MEIAFIATVDDIVVHREKCYTIDKAQAEMSIKRKIARMEGQEHGWHDMPASVIHYRRYSKVEWFIRPWVDGDTEIFNPI